MGNKYDYITKAMLMHKIFCGSELIAKFKNESDRDVCLNWLADYYDVGMSTAPKKDEETPNDER